jgi:hypothetical protein
MDKKPYPSETQERFIVRFPDGMRDRIAEAAKAAGRSMNAEIVNRLDGSFRSVDVENAAGILLENQRLQEMVDAQRKTIQAQDVTAIMLSTYLIDVLNALPKKIQGEDRIKAAAQFVLGLGDGTDLPAQQSMLQLDTSRSKSNQ